MGRRGVAGEEYAKWWGPKRRAQRAVEGGAAMAIACVRALRYAACDEEWGSSAAPTRARTEHRYAGVVGPGACMGARPRGHPAAAPGEHVRLSVARDLDA